MEHEQKLTEQQRTALSQLETLRIEMHRVVDERVDGSIHRILLGGVLNIAPTLPLTANSAAFKGEKPESILFPGGREVKTPTWKTAVLAIMQDCNEDPVMHAHLMGLRGKVLGRQRTILAASPEKMHAPLEIDKDLYMESYYDTATLLYVLKNRVLDEVGYSSLFWASAHWRWKTSKTPKKKRKRLFWRKMNSFVPTCCGQSLMIFGLL